MSDYRFVLLFIPLIIMMMAGGISCGKKGDPVRNVSKQMTPDVGLKIQKTAGAIVVLWPVDRNQREESRFKVERSVLDPKTTDCPGCPQKFDAVADISIDSLECREDNNKRCRYNDYNVIEGYRYIYRLLSCDGAGRCSVISSPAEIKF
jgi:hypothetical protein